MLANTNVGFAIKYVDNQLVMTDFKCFIDDRSLAARVTDGQATKLYRSILSTVRTEHARNARSNGGMPACSGGSGGGEAATPYRNGENLLTIFVVCWWSRGAAPRLLGTVAGWTQKGRQLMRSVSPSEKKLNPPLPACNHVRSAGNHVTWVSDVSLNFHLQGLRDDHMRIEILSRNPVGRYLLHFYQADGIRYQTKQLTYVKIRAKGFTGLHRFRLRWNVN